MATLETQILDDVVVKTRRKMLTLGGTALAGLILGGSKEAHAATTYSDADILNFALNLEYLEANFYYMAAFGTTIDKPNTASMAAGGPAAGIPITGSVGTAGGTALVVGAQKVPFTSIAVGSYATETAIEEGKHVLFLQSALSTAAVAQPVINIGTAWQGLGAALSPAAPTFNPYQNDATFLLGAYVFEDVGVTAYHGAASLLTVSGNLVAAAGILGVEAYHAGLVRTTINANDANSNSLGFGALIPTTTAISTLRASLAAAAATAAKTSSIYDSSPDDFGVAAFTPPSALGAAAYTGMATRIVDADATSVIAFARTTTQVLNIVTGGGAVSSSGAVVSPATGVFFPNGLNAGPNGFK
jgi:hypothetical protein